MEEKIDKNKIKLVLALNLLLIVLEIVGLIFAVFEFKVQVLRYFTQDSNIFALIASVIFSIYLIKQLKDGKPMPKFVKYLKYMSTCCLTLTFLVVLFILTPLGDLGFGFMLFHGSMLFHHTLCPILAIITFLFFERYEKFGKKQYLIGMIPVVIYAIIFLTLNIARLIVGPYFFFEVYNQAWYMNIVWGVVLLGMTYLIVWGFGSLKNLISKKKQ